MKKRSVTVLFAVALAAAVSITATGCDMKRTNSSGEVPVSMKMFPVIM